MLLDSPMLITVLLSSFAMAMRTFGTLSLERRRRIGRHSAAKVPHEIRPSRRNDSHCLTYLLEGRGGEGRGGEGRGGEGRGGEGRGGEGRGGEGRGGEGREGRGGRGGEGEKKAGEGKEGGSDL